MKIKFEDEELKNQLLFEIYREEDGANGPGFTRFGGFFREEVLLRARDTRRMYGIFQYYNKVLGDRMRMSDYLSFLASLFREIEDQRAENPCAEVHLRGGIGDRLNIRPPDEILPPLATEHPMFDKTIHRCPRCGATSDAAPFDPPGPSCSRVPCYGRGET